MIHLIKSQNNVTNKDKANVSQALSEEILDLDKKLLEIIRRTNDISGIRLEPWLIP